MSEPKFDFMTMLKKTEGREYEMPEVLTMEKLQPMFDSISKDGNEDSLLNLITLCANYESKSANEAERLLEAMTFVRSVTE